MASGASRGSVVLRIRLMRDSNRRRHRSPCIEMLPFDDEYHKKSERMHRFDVRNCLRKSRVAL